MAKCRPTPTLKVTRNSRGTPSGLGGRPEHARNSMRTHSELTRARSELIRNSIGTRPDTPLERARGTGRGRNPIGTEPETCSELDRNVALDYPELGRNQHPQPIGTRSEHRRGAELARNSTDQTSLGTRSEHRSETGSEPEPWHRTRSELDRNCTGTCYELELNCARNFPELGRNQHAKSSGTRSEPNRGSEPAGNSEQAAN